MMTPNYNFDRGKIFYPLVMNCYYSMHGFMELASRGLIHCLASLGDSDSQDSVDKAVEQIKMSKELQEKFKKTKEPTPLIGNLEFKIHNGTGITTNITELATEILSNGAYLADSLTNSLCILLISAYAKTTDWDNPSDPIWNFFYHCRNASAHNNRFRIDKPRFPAKWRQLEITKAMNRTRLFKGKKGAGLLYPGDAIALLWDIEQRHPSMKLKQET
jgi:hypothetical protein